MPQPRRGLGKGLGALIPTGPPPVSGSAPDSAGGAWADRGDAELAGRIPGAYLEEVPGRRDRAESAAAAAGI